MKREQLLKEMGLGPIWKLRGSAAAPSENTATDAVNTTGKKETVSEVRRETGAALQRICEAVDQRSSEIAAMDWPALKQAIKVCDACELCRERQQAVVGVGDENADLLFVGEGPGAEEDARGEPFVGQAGKLLDAMLAAIDLQRGNKVYIANAVKCRPPGNRTPDAAETTSCWPFLARQIELIQPRLIVALGKPAAQTLLRRDVKIGDARGQLHDFFGRPLIVCYHPAYLLRNQPEKAKAWQDLCFIRKTLGQL